MKLIQLLFAGLLILLAGCREQKQSGNIIWLDKNDTEMNRAISKGRASLPEFWEAFKNRSQEIQSPGLKLVFRDGDNAEYMWVRDLGYDGPQLVGVVDNRPVLVQNVSVGEKIKIDESHIVDWKFFDQGVLCGGQTIAVLLERTTPEEAAKIRKKLGWKY